MAEMKKQTLILILFLTFFKIGYSQLSDSMKLYYFKVNLAELSISDSAYIDALKYYNEAFNLKKKPFCKDKFNSAICFALQGNNKYTYLTLKYIIQYGYSLNDIRNKKVFDRFFLSRYGKKLVSFEKKKLVLYNRGIRDSYDSLLHKDQYFRIKKGSYDVYGDTIRKINKTNVVCLLKLIEKYGNPSEQLIGVYPNFDFNPFNILVTHNYVGSKTGQIFDFSEILYKAIYSGDLDSRVAASLITGSIGKDIYGSFFLGLIQYGILDKNEPELIKKGSLSGYGLLIFNPNEKTKKTNIEREKIGLDSIEEARKKLSFQYYHNDFCLINMGEAKKGFLFSNEEEYNNKLKNLILLK